LEQSWPRSAAEARQLQERLREQVITKDEIGVVRRVAGVDARYGAGHLWAAVVVMTLPDIAVIENALICHPLSFPYAGPAVLPGSAGNP